ncbi:hypothetical protein L3X38_001878 [Prunus dulcis]|uniref:Uncharacterized protein n=1 Tax=Prunus dulcis TaxID=3755 RepID=A0AAD4WV94_PRUDU|nr:hypothetical protein L3X38_001878 [Prunus dulcis]
MVRNKVRKEMSSPKKNEHQVGKGQRQWHADIILALGPAQSAGSHHLPRLAFVAGNHFFAQTSPSPSPALAAGNALRAPKLQLPKFGRKEPKLSTLQTLNLGRHSFNSAVPIRISQAPTPPVVPSRISQALTPLAAQLHPALALRFKTQPRLPQNPALFSSYQTRPHLSSAVPSIRIVLTHSPAKLELSPLHSPSHVVRPYSSLRS